MAGTSPVLHIGRVRTEYLLSSEHPSPDSVRSWLDEAAVKGLPDALSQFLSPLLSEDDPSIWLIRKLELDVNLNAGWDRDQIAKRWAMEITRSLDHAFRGRGDGQNVVRFVDRSAYLSEFLADAAEGRAWSKWYYGQFDGLRMLPLSAALRTAIGEKSEIGLNALLRLSSSDLSTVLRALNAQDARRVLLSISGEGKNDKAIDCLKTINAVLCKGAPTGPSLDPEWNAVLHLYLAACLEQREISGPALRKTSLAIIRLARLLKAAPDSGKGKILNALASRNSAALGSFMNYGDGEVLAPLIDAPSDLVHETTVALVRLLGQGTSSTTSDHAETLSVRETAMGGIFLLLPFLAELSLAEAINGWPEVEEVPADCALRMLILSKCFGPIGYRVFTDPLTRDLLGVPPSVTVSAILRWQKRITRQHINMLDRALKAQSDEAAGQNRETTENDLVYLTLQKPFRLSRFLDRTLSNAALILLRSFSRRLPGFSGSSAEYLFRNFLGFPASVEEEAGRRIVRIGRPTLNLVLTMTGMTRQTYVLPWLDERPLALFQEG